MNNENKTNINRNKAIYRKLFEITENNCLFTSDFFVFRVIMFKL